jgi:ligand-binding sensor domain-containing protein
MRNCLHFLVLLAFPLCCSAQVPGWSSFRLQEDNKPFKINALLKGKDGYIYAGSTNGLYKFDGINFLPISFSKAPVHDTITALFEDATGSMWVGFKNGKLAKKTNGQLQFLDPPEGSPRLAITCFLQDQQRNIWFGTNGEGLYRFNNDHLYLIDEENGLSDKHIHGLAMASDGKILAITDQGINICSTQGNKTSIQIIGPKNGLPDYYVTSIFSAGNDFFWMGMQEKGICLFDYKKQAILHSTANWNEGQINAIFANQKQVWLATESAGILVKSVSDTSNNFQKWANYNGSINLLLQDKEGNLWMNASTELIRTNGDKIQLLPLYDKQLFETIHTIYPDQDNNIWAGTDGAVIRFSYQQGKLVSKTFPLAGFTAQTDITSLYQDLYGHIWIGSMGNGIVVLDPQTGKYRAIKENSLLNNASILSISGAGNTVCAGGLEGAAVIFHLTETNRNLESPFAFSNYNNIANIGNNYIYCILKDSRDRIWFGTDGKGVTVLDHNQFTTYTAKDGLKDEHITAITEDHQQQIWLATEDQGLYRFRWTSI